VRGSEEKSVIEELNIILKPNDPFNFVHTIFIYLNQI